MHPLRPWAATVPWTTLVAAIEPRLAPRFPHHSPRGRPPVSSRIWLALEWLQHALGASDASLCHRLAWTVPSWTPGASCAPGGLPPRRLVCCPQRWPSFVSVLRQPCWTTGSPPPPRRPWRRGLAARRPTSSRPSRAPRRRACDHPEEPSLHAPPPSGAVHAPLSSALPRAGPRLRDTGAAHGT